MLAYAAYEAARDGCRVLIACPVGPLIDVYKDRLPACENIVVETVHSSWKINREGQEIYSPPGRLRQYNLIIFDEISQLDDEVWRALFNGLKEFPNVYVVFAGDMDQLQPVHGQGLFKRWIEKMVRDDGVRHVTLLQHEFARSTDPVLLDFLREVRTNRPDRARLNEFFGERMWGCDEWQAIQKSILLEQERQKYMWISFPTLSHRANRPPFERPAPPPSPFPPARHSPHLPTRHGLVKFVSAQHQESHPPLTPLLHKKTRIPMCFLTVTNKAAQRFNCLRLRAEFAAGNLQYEFGSGATLDELFENSDWHGDPKAHNGKMIFAKGMRIRLTRNLDKDRGFVNGAVGTIHHMLSPCTFVLKTDRGVMLLVHPVAQDGQVFMPCSYGYAMTIRRAQGSTLGIVALCAVPLKLG